MPHAFCIARGRSSARSVDSALALFNEASHCPAVQIALYSQVYSRVVRIHSHSPKCHTPAVRTLRSILVLTQVACSNAMPFAGSVVGLARGSGPLNTAKCRLPPLSLWFRFQPLAGFSSTSGDESLVYRTQDYPGFG